jgi:hypothetical protein
MMGYTEKDIYDMLEGVNIAYEIIDGPADIEEKLRMTADFLEGVLVEGRI